MGNRAILQVGSCFEIESNNCIPVTWFALFDRGELHSQTIQDGGEEYETIAYETTAKRALTRIQPIISSLKDKNPVWSFLRPIQVLQDEISHIPTDTTITLDVTQFWFYDESMQKQITKAPSHFLQLVSGLTGNRSHDITLLDNLISLYNLGQFSSVLDYPLDNLVFLLFGSFSGEDEERYSPEFFNESFWELPDDPEFRACERRESLDVEFTELERERCLEHLRFYKSLPPQGWSDLNAAICLTKLQNYKRARSFYRAALKRFLKYRTDHFLVTQLLHSYMLANQPRQFSNVRLRITTMIERSRLIPAHHYALSVLALLDDTVPSGSEHVNELLKAQDSQYRSIGTSVAALVDRNLPSFEDGLVGVIVSHHRMLKSGIIREGYLCLPAMTMALAGLSVGMETEIESKYFSKGYLDFLHNSQSFDGPNST